MRKQKATTRGVAPLRLEWLDAAELKANPSNWRKHPAKQLDALRDVIDEVGWAGALLYNERTKRLIDGHARKEIANRDGKVPVLVGRWTEQQEKKILATLDPIATLAEADKGKLESLLRSVESDSEAANALLENLAVQNHIQLNGAVQEDDPPIDRAAELQKKWNTKRGQLWTIGKHRLLCGDSTDKGDVARVMDGKKAGLMNTDPPYGVGYANDERPHPGVAKPRVAKPRVAKDELQDEALQSFLESVFHLAAQMALKANAAWYLWHAHLTQGFFAAAAAAANVVLHRQIIWVKPVLLLTRGQYHWKHEPCFMGWVQGNQPPDYGMGCGERTQTTVWEIDSVPTADRKEFNHSTPKPVGLFTTPIVKHLKRNEIAYEPFAGSGPQFVAAEQLGRLCYGLEIEPKYAAVCLERLASLGLKPKLE